MGLAACFSFVSRDTFSNKLTEGSSIAGGGEFKMRQGSQLKSVTMQTHNQGK